jgi:periplasmic protein TonB
MRDPFLRSFSGNNPSNDSLQDSWLNRIRENLAHLLIPSHFKPSSANGAPIHLLKFDKSARPARAQTVSLATHVAIFAAVLYLIGHTTTRTPRPLPLGPGTLTLDSSTLRNILGAKPEDGGGSGGANNPIPARHGDLPPYSSIVLVKPTLPTDRQSQAPVPPTLFDADAPPILRPTPNIGLPWMPNDTNSGGPGPGNTIGSKGGNNIGDNGPDQAGSSNSYGRPGANISFPACAYCPYPTYTDEARHVKVQGTVTLEVLVGTDGRAQDVRVIKGIGYGLDERAVETVKGWHFIPARDTAKRAVAVWVTVETTFRLF